MKGFSSRLASFLDDNSTFGRITGNLWLIIITNVLFVLCSLPVITAGPAFAAMYHVILKSMRSPYDEISPVREFWKGLKGNFGQAMIVWLLFLAIAAVAVLDIDIIRNMQESLQWIRWPVYLTAGIVLLVYCFVFPVLAAFESSTIQLLNNAFYFTARNPFRAVVIAAVNVLPMVITYLDLQRLPLYAFLWSTCGFSVTAAVISRILIKDFSRFLPDPDDFADGED